MSACVCFVCSCICACVRMIQKSRVAVPPCPCRRGGWNKVAPEDIIPVLPSDEQDEDEEDENQPYTMHQRLDISNERIDLQRPTEVLLMRREMLELEKKVNRWA